jgi:hypothetical protein
LNARWRHLASSSDDQLSKKSRRHNRYMEARRIATYRIPLLRLYVGMYLRVDPTKELNSVAFVRKRTIHTEGPPHVGEFIANIWEYRGVAWSAQQIPTAVNLDFLNQEPLLFHSIGSSVILTRLGGPRSRPTTSQNIW